MVETEGSDVDSVDCADACAVFVYWDTRLGVFEDSAEEVERKRWNLEARGKARGRRKERYIEVLVWVSAIASKLIVKQLFTKI